MKKKNKKKVEKKEEKDDVEDGKIMEKLGDGDEGNNGDDG